MLPHAASWTDNMLTRILHLATVLATLGQILGAVKGLTVVLELGVVLTYALI